jgi:guanylate kinase
MIITLRGTNGCGKSTIVDQIRRMYSHVQVAYPPETNKRRPMGYICNIEPSRKRLFIPGHYCIANGGMDTINSLNYAYELILKHHMLGASVLFEGKVDGIARILKMHAVGIDVRVIFIKLPLADCIKAVRRRGHEMSEETITGRYLKHQRELEACRDTINHTYYLTRKETQQQILEWLQ